jgi:hypothetical protein
MFTFYPKEFTTFWVLESDTVSTVARVVGIKSPYKVGYGKAATISVRLIDANGAALPGFGLGLQRWTGKAWVPVASLSPVAGSPGSYRVRRAAYKGSRTTYRVVLRGNSLYTARPVSAAVVPKAKMTKPKLSAITPRSGRAFYVSGRMYPAHKGTVKLRYERYVLGRWRHVSTKTVTAKSTGVYRSKTTLQAGTWRVRASHQDKGHLMSRSSWRTFSVRRVRVAYQNTGLLVSRITWRGFLVR